MQIEHISNINYRSFNNYTSNSNLKYVNIFLAQMEVENLH